MVAVRAIHVCAVERPHEAAAAAQGLARDLGGAGVATQLCDVGECFTTPAGYGQVEAAVARAVEVVESLNGPLVITHASLPPVLAPMGFEVQCRLAAALDAGVVLVNTPPDPAAVASAADFAATHRAEVIGLRGQEGQWRSWGLDDTDSPAPGQRLPLIPISADLGVAEVLRSMAGATLAIPAERADVLVGLTLALGSGEFTGPASIQVQGNPAPGVMTLLREYAPTLPISTCPDDPGPQASAAQLLAHESRRRERVRGMTPLEFTRELLTRARQSQRHIVLPEGEEPRIVRAAGEVLRLGAARLTLLGDPEQVSRVARDEGIDLTGAEILDPATSPLRARFAQEYAALRARKGVSLDQAHERVGDVSYFATMMVHDGLADGMVSGAIHTTAHTIRPAFEIIKTRPGATVVSSVFFMCLRDQVLVFADCAVNPNPSAEELADIAHASAQTARQFGIEPRVGLLSYSTGTSGTGPDVDLVMKACQLATERHPELRLDGPLQFDAATVPSVARTKAPGSEVAGRANVLVFPDLSAGNITYKAVQRTAGALAIGPVLQGLNKPVNDLSRGALVPDIVNTVLVTAVQAGQP